MRVRWRMWREPCPAPASCVINGKCLAVSRCPGIPADEIPANPASPADGPAIESPKDCATHLFLAQLEGGSS